MRTKLNEGRLNRKPIFYPFVALLLVFGMLCSTACKPQDATDDSTLDRDQSLLGALELSGGKFGPSSRDHDPVLEKLQEDGYREYENEDYFVFFSNKHDTAFSIERKAKHDGDQADRHPDATSYEKESLRLYKVMQAQDAAPHMEGEKIDLDEGGLTRLELHEVEDGMAQGTAGAFTYDASGKLLLAAIYDEDAPQENIEGNKESNISDDMALDIAKTAVLSDKKLNRYEWHFLPAENMPTLESHQDTWEWKVDLPVAIHGELEGTSQAFTVYIDAETGKTNTVFSSLN